MTAEPVAATDVGTDRRAFLKQLLLQRAAADGSMIYPLSRNQASLWYLYEYAPESVAYNVALAAWVSSDTDAAALGRALNAVVVRHPALRTTFHTVAGRPMQYVRPVLEIPLVTVAADDWDEAALQARVADDYAIPFDLTGGPGLRATLYERARREGVLLLVVHHTLADLWSLAIVLSELGEFYAAERVGSVASPPPTPSASYAGFVHWQHELAARPDGQEHRAYWEQQLRGAATVLDLPADRPRPPLLSLSGDSVAFTLPAEVTVGLQALARQEGTSLYTVLLAAFQAMLFRYTEQDDILVGSPVAGRSRPEFDEVVGHFVNMIALRGRPRPRVAFREFLADMRTAVLGALEHQDYPFTALVEDLQPPRDPSRTPVFQVCFAYQRAPKLEALGSFLVPATDGPPVAVGGLEIRPFPLTQQQGQFDLSLWMAESDGALHGELKYADALFERETIERMAAHLTTLLTGVVRDPDQALADLPMLTEAERRLVVDEWNATATPYRRDAVVHELFEEQVDRTPDAIAAVGPPEDGRSLTYAELEAEANRIANHLTACGVGRGGLVGVFLDRSVDMLPAVLGVLKAGAGYVPLERHLPPARIELILSSLTIRCVLTQPCHLDTLRGLDLPLLDHVVCLPDPPTQEPVVDPPLTGSDERWRTWSASDLAMAPAGRPPRRSTAEDTAYIIFTSGSTGTPKGVEVRHRPVINLIEWVNTTHQVGSADRVLFVTALSFDLSVYDIFGVLAAGGSVRVASRDELRDPERLVDVLLTEAITLWDSAPPALQQLVPFLPAEPADGTLRLVFLSGDWIPLPLPDQIRRVFRQAQVVSLGGATEATIWSNWYPIAEVSDGWASIPYGRPIQNARYYVLDQSGNPCPIGVPGELFIGGECLASGYVYDPDLTAAKFVPDPFSDAPDAMMYRTGDRVRYWADGNLEFLGRTDFQVKVRGYRIELGEIETLLTTHPSVAECVVTATGERGGDRELVAYIVVADGAELPSTADLRAFGKERLPEYMVPSHFMVIERIPMTANGKVDRKALPEPERRRDVAATYMPPRDELETTLCEVWAHALRLSRIGVHDDFFELGGHSLLAVQIVHEVHDRLGRRCPVSALLRAPTVAELAAHLRSDGGGPASVLVPLRSTDDESVRTLFAFHPAGGEVLAYRPLVDALDPSWAVAALRSRAIADPAIERERLGDMVEDYLAAIRAHQPEGPYRLLGWSFGGVLAHAVAARLEANGEAVAFLGLIDSGLPQLVPELAERLTYRVGAVFGSLAGLLLDLPDRDEVVPGLLERPAARRVRAALDLLVARGIVPEDVSADAIEAEAALAQRHQDLLEQYEPRTVAAPTWLWWAEQSLEDSAPPTDWGQFTSAPATIAVVPGAHHYSIVRVPHVATVAEGIAAAHLSGAQQLGA